MTTVMFTRAGAVYTVRFDYNAAVVELLKSTVPAHARTWDKTGKQWAVDADWYQRLAAAMRAAGCTVVGLDDTRQQAHDGKEWAHTLFTAVGPARVPAVHRALTKVLHPDTATGCPVLQRELNDARAELESVK